jgi:hypothetical protein
VVDGSPLIGAVTHGDGSNREPQDKRMIGDFDGSANALWSLYGTEAKSRDESQIQTLKDDMDGVLIFVSSHFVRSYEST